MLSCNNLCIIFCGCLVKATQWEQCCGFWRAFPVVTCHRQTFHSSTVNDAVSPRVGTGRNMIVKQTECAYQKLLHSLVFRVFKFICLEICSGLNTVICVLYDRMYDRMLGLILTLRPQACRSIRTTEDLGFYQLPDFHLCAEEIQAWSSACCLGGHTLSARFRNRL